LSSRKITGVVISALLLSLAVLALHAKEIAGAGQHLM